MQHFGMPTRLLDVTQNPLVALYFAVSEERSIDKDASFWISTIPPERVKYFDSDAVSCLANLSNLSLEEKSALIAMSHVELASFNASAVVQRLLQFIRAEKPHFTSSIEPVDLFRPCHVIPKQSNRRILAQAGAFQVYGLDGSLGGPKYAKTINHQAYRIEAAAKPNMIDDLDKLGINGSTLFPEIENAAAYIRAKYK